MNIERLPYLLARHQEGALNYSEWEELKHLMDREDWVQFIVEDLDKTYPLPTPVKWNKASIEQVWQKIDPARKIAVPVHRVHFLKTAWFRYAAAIILVLGTAVYF